MILDDDVRRAIRTPSEDTSWTWGVSYVNILRYTVGYNNYIGIATCYTGSIGNRDNTLKNYNVAT